MSTSLHFVPRRSPAFTLVELLVSMSILMVILLLLVQITESTRRTWLFTTGKIGEFREAREAFEGMSRRLAQATLNTYWDYNDVKNPTKYLRQSELRFISGPAATLIGSGTSPRVSHAVFFQAPLGYVEDTKFSQLQNLLNTWGYYIEWNDDSASRPPFINALNPPPPSRWRFRLMELMEPSESLSVYSLPTGTAWFTTPLSKPGRTRVLAENILMIALLPYAPPPAKVTELAPSYTYDSSDKSNAATMNQLPPLIRVSMVALDEATFGRSQGSSKELPDWWKNAWWTNANDGNQDKAKIIDELNKRHIKFREFTTEIAIRGAKWSTN